MITVSYFSINTLTTLLPPVLALSWLTKHYYSSDRTLPCPAAAAAAAIVGTVMRRRKCLPPSLQVGAQGSAESRPGRSLLAAAADTAAGCEMVR